MESIEVKVLQELFKNKNSYLVSTKSGYTGVTNSYGSGVQGEWNETFHFYRHPKMPENLFFRETYHTDSYGDNESIVSIDFVEGKEKTITVFEPI
jgi:hypothetical protein